MNDQPLIPISDEQAKLGQEMIKAARDMGSYVADILADLPQDLLGLLIGDRVKAARAERVKKLWKKSERYLEAENAQAVPPNPKIAGAILFEAADETSEELRDLWSRLLAAAVHSERSKKIRLAFIETAKKLDPIDALVLRHVHNNVQAFTPTTCSKELSLPFDEVFVTFKNLEGLGLLYNASAANYTTEPFARLFMSAIDFK